MPILPSQRHLFDIPREIAYFNCAYYSPQLNESRDRLLAGVRAKSHAWTRLPPSFFDDAETLRGLWSRIFGGDADGYAVVPAASYALSTAARAIEPHLNPGDRVLMIADEFPSNVLPWKRTAQEKGASLVTVPAPGDGDWTNAVLPFIEPRVKVVAISTCHWTTGARIDLEPIAAAARANGSSLVVDATQTLGAMPFPMDSVQPDFLTAAAYKWQLGPYGVGLLYVAPRWRNARPLEESWLARDNAEDFTSLADYSDNYMKGARRFDVGEKGSLNTLPGAIAALEQIDAWGVENIASTLSMTNSRIAAHLEQLGFRVPIGRHRCPHMFGAVLPASYRGGLVAELRKRHIYISQRGNSLRFAPHLWVDDHDVNRLLGTLDELVG
ncbi:MAG TPA: aminotransferase class V-fold PLP-dependent enzyme [Vicinamibacteria bacterium]|nr:aminotransferase class V-fold PLP-dependent enzyme [Vicinamibacteria bacterium]